MSAADFYREWHLGELFDATMLARVGPPLAELLDGDQPRRNTAPRA